RFVAGISARWNEPLGSHSRFPWPREQSGFRERTELRRDPKDGRRGQGIEASCTLNERQAWRFGGNQTPAQSQLLAQPDGRGLLDQQGIRSAVDRVSVDVFTENHTARACAGFQQNEWNVTTMEFVGG